MGVLGAPEIREISLGPKERAQARDSYVRSFDAQFADWSSIAKVCIDVQRDKDYELLGFESYHQWLLAAAPKSRSFIYWAVSVYQKLIPDIPEEDLAQIPPGSASVLVGVSPAVRRMSNIRQVAREKPAKLREVIKKHFPEQHVEILVEKKLRFPVSAWEVVEDAWECYRVMEDDAMSLEAFIEWQANDYLDSLTEDGKTSRRTVWEQIKADARKSDQRRQDNSDGIVVH